MDSHHSSTSSRRLRIPDKPKSASLSLWGLMKNCIGKDISTVSLPVNFNEPLSLLQRLTEQLEYAELLDKAASCSCPYEQMAYLAVFIVSGYSNCNRITKPFNPLLGETFEFDRRDDLGWRIISEQISHHPPKIANHCEGNGWKFWQEFSFETKFTGKDIQVTPTGEANIEFSSGYLYTWNKIITIVHNFIIGNAWVEHQGDIDIIGKKDTEEISCRLNFIQGKVRTIKGEVKDATGHPRWKIEGEISAAVSGNCNDYVELSVAVSMESENVQYSEPTMAWKSRAPPDGSKYYYGFSIFACQLNEPEDGVAPTDSRCRPDQRLMEEGRWEEAYQEKTRLEEKQREVIKKRSEEEDENLKLYIPIWFKPIQREDGSIFHEFKGDYWICKENKDWSKCPNIF